MAEVTKGAAKDSMVRDHLANERTFLAWLRTGLSLVAVGVAVAGFLPLDLIPGFPYVTVFASTLALTGTAIVIARREIEDGTYVPTPLSIVIITVVVALLGIMAVPLVFLLR